MPVTFLGLDGFLPIAHRGGGAEAPENSLSAFRRAAALGYQVLETDARATSDGVLVAHHDARLDRTTDRQGLIRRQPWSSVRLARVGEDPISRLADLLEEFPSSRFNVDVKESAAIAPLVELIRSTRSQHRICVTSFSARRLNAVRSALGEGLVTALSPPEVLGLASVARGRRLLAHLAGRGSCVQVPERLGPAVLTDGRLVDAAHRLGLPVHVWTVNSAEVMRRLLELGVDGIMTDEITLLLSVIGDLPGNTSAEDRVPEPGVRDHARHDDGLQPHDCP